MIEVPIQGGIFLLALLGLLLGAEWLVKGSSRIAKALGVNPVVIGLTIVAFGTSSPELVVTLLAAVKNSDGIAIGNILGSNIANIGLILGLSSLVSPLKVQSSVVRIDLPVMIAVSLLFVFMLLHQKVSFYNGLMLFLGLLCYISCHLYTSIKASKRNQPKTDETDTDNHGNLTKNLVFVIVGLVLLLAGAHQMVRSGVVLARILGVSEVIIGLTLVSVGTSLPELATSISCAIRKESDILVGNVIGSNIFNILCVLGVVGMVSPLSMDSSLMFFEVSAFLVFSFALVPFMKSGFVLTRFEGGILLAGYGIFIAMTFSLS